MRIILFFILISVSFFISCTDKEPEGKEYVTLAYKQTKCADPWPTAPTDSLTAFNVEHYLDSSGLFFIAVIVYDNDIAETCTACTCKTGKTIYVTTYSMYKNNYNSIGFY